MDPIQQPEWLVGSTHNLRDTNNGEALNKVTGYTSEQIGAFARKKLKPTADVYSNGLACFVAVIRHDCSHFSNCQWWRAQGSGESDVQVGQYCSGQYQDLRPQAPTAMSP